MLMFLYKPLLSAIRGEAVRKPDIRVNISHIESMKHLSALW